MMDAETWMGAAISIHAAQEGCDICFKRQGSSSGNFNPRSPRGLRQIILENKFVPTVFQSTQPKRAATRENGFKVPT